MHNKLHAHTFGTKFALELESYKLPNCYVMLIRGLEITEVI